MTTRRILPAALLLSFALAACGGDPAPPAAAPSSPPAATSVAASPSGSPRPDGYAVRACQRNAEALDATGDKTIEMLAAVAYEAKESEFPPIAQEGVLLGLQVEMAEKAQGASDEAAMEAGAVAAAFEFATACVNAGMVY